MLPSSSGAIAREVAFSLWVTYSSLTEHRAVFKIQLANKKFLAAYETALKRSTSDLHALLLKALMVLSFEAQTDKHLSAITTCYNKVKNPDDAVNGQPLPEDDVTFEPQGNRAHRGSRRNHRESRKSYWREAEVAKNNAKMLSEALSFTPPDQLDSNELVNEFYAACQRSQNVLVDAIPSITQKAEQSRRQATSPERTTEEALLTLLTEANNEVTAAFAMYDDGQRRKRVADEEKMVSERSVMEQRMPQSQDPQAQTHPASTGDPYGGLLSAPFAASNGGASGSSSRSHSSQPPAVRSAPSNIRSDSAEATSYTNKNDENEPYDLSTFSQAPPLTVAPQRTESPTSMMSSGQAHNQDENPFANSVSPEPDSSQPVTVTRRGSKLMSNNPFASAITRERITSDSSKERQTLSTLTQANASGSLPPSQSMSSMQSLDSFQPHQSPDRSLSHIIPEESPAPDAQPDRNPFHAQMRQGNFSASSPGSAHFSGVASSSSAAGPPASPSSTFGRQRKVSQAESIVPTPVEPSEKAYGKLRRMSGMYGSDLDEVAKAEEANRQNEEKLRGRYSG